VRGSRVRSGSERPVSGGGMGLGGLCLAPHRTVVEGEALDSERGDITYMARFIRWALTRDGAALGRRSGRHKSSSGGFQIFCATFAILTTVSEDTSGIIRDIYIYKKQVGAAKLLQNTLSRQAQARPRFKSMHPRPSSPRRLRSNKRGTLLIMENTRPPAAKHKPVQTLQHAKQRDDRKRQRGPVHKRTRALI
jgi:hypothetical protein